MKTADELIREEMEAKAKPCPKHGDVERIRRAWRGITLGCAPAYGHQWVCPLCEREFWR